MAAARAPPLHALPSIQDARDLSLSTPFRPNHVEISSTRTERGGSDGGGGGGGGKQYTLYVILVKWGDKAWTVARRYSQFDTLHRALSRVTSRLPDLPPKTWLRSFKSDFVEERRGKLQAYLRGLLRLPVVLHTPALQVFLDCAPPNVPEALLSREHLPSKVLSLEDESYGVNDFVFDIKAQTVFTACEDVELLRKVDATLSNIRLPWEEETDRFTPLGSVCAWVLEGAEWSDKVTQHFESPATALAWDALRRYLFVGLANGHVQVFDVELDVTKMTLVHDLHLHSERVSRVVYDAKRDRLVTASHDKTMTVLDVKNRMALLASGKCGNAWLADMAFEEESGTAMLAAYSSEMLVVDVTEDSPHVITKIQGHRGSVRSIHYAPADRYVFTGGFDNAIAVYNLGPAEQLYRSRLLTVLHGGPPSRIKAITFSEELNLVLAGHDSGLVSVWDLAGEGTLLHVFTAHSTAVLRMFWISHQHILMTAGHDREVRFWKFRGAEEVVEQEVVEQEVVEQEVVEQEVVEEPVVEEPVEEQEDDEDMF